MTVYHISSMMASGFSIIVGMILSIGISSSVEVSIDDKQVKTAMQETVPQFIFTG